MKTDELVRQDVLAELAWDPSVDATQLSVEVHEGQVTLSGVVGSQAQRRNAERAAERVAGVTALALDLEVIVGSTAQRTDADIVRVAAGALRGATSVPRDAVKVMVEAGWITLSGQVAWEFQRRAAVQAVHDLLGVTGITDLIIIQPPAAVRGVKSGIEAALRRRADGEARAIQVEVRGCDVVLSGTVHSWSERDLVCHCAWNTPGVSNVLDNLRLSA